MEYNFNELFHNNTIKIHESWLNIDDLELKLLVLIKISGNTKDIYRGTLSDIAKWLNVKTSTSLNNRLKNAIEELQDKYIIEYEKSGYTYKLRILEEYENYIDFPIVWINQLKTFNEDENGNKKNNNVSIDWIKLVKILCALYFYIDEDENFTIPIFSMLSGVNEASLRNAFRYFNKGYIELERFELVKEVNRRIVSVPNTDEETKEKIPYYTFPQTIGNKIRTFMNVIE